MTVRFERPVSHAARIALRLGQFALVLALSATLAHRFGPLKTPDFLGLLLFAATAAALAVPFAVFGLVRLWQIGARGGIAAVTGLVFAAIPIATIAAGSYVFETRPKLYDLSSDLTDPPPWLAAPATAQQWLPRPPQVAAAAALQVPEAYPGLTGRRYEGAIDRVYLVARKVAVSSRIAIVRSQGLANAEPDLSGRPAKPATGRDPLAAVPIPLPRPDFSIATPLFGRSGDVLLQGTARSLLFGFPFDVMIRLREEAETTLVDIRVAARYGPSDLGLGDALAESYLQALDSELLGIAGG
jgi:hypothetical protein